VSGDPHGIPPDDISSLPLAERRIREAMAAGEFDRLPGSGKPIPDLDVGDDPAWWAKRWVRRERLRDLLREVSRRREDEVLRARAERCVEEARRRLAAIEAEVAALNARVDEDDRLPPLDVERILGRLRKGTG
jgi:hypothetical protein